MKLTAPQKYMLLENQATIEDYKIAIKRKPGALEYYLDLAKKRGFGNNDLKALLGFALKEKIINLPMFKHHEGRLELAKTRKYRKTGKLDPRDSAIHKDEDEDVMTVKCVNCKKTVRADQASLGGAGWVCSSCK